MNQNSEKSLQNSQVNAASNRVAFAASSLYEKALKKALNDVKKVSKS